MLTHPAPATRRARAPLSLRQEYEEFLLQRIEEFKEQLSRDKLLTLADEAVRELEAGPEGQLVLTEVLVLEHVDRLIMKRLKLPTYRRWRERHVRMRQAQRELTHWRLPARTPLRALALRLEDRDVAMVVGSSLASAACFLAAHEANVLFIDNNLSAVEAIETRAATEGLALRMQALVVELSGRWMPDATPALTVLDPGKLAALESTARDAVMEALQTRTPRGGVHFLLQEEHATGVRSLAAEALQEQYADWQVERGGTDGDRWRWVMAVKP